MNITEVPKAYHFSGKGRRPLRGQTGNESGGSSRRQGQAPAASSVPATRQIGGMADGVDGPPQEQRQAPLRATAAGPAYTAGSLMDILTRNKTGETNPAFDPNKPIGGDNVPYKETTGIGGWFARLAGNKANQLNAEAQARQGEEWKAEDAEVRKARREADRDAARDAAADKRLDKTLGAQKAELDAKLQADRERAESDRQTKEQALINEGFEKQAAMDAAEKRHAETLGLEREKLEVMKGKGTKTQPQIEKLGEGLFMRDPATGEMQIINPAVPGFGDKPGKPAQILPLRAATPPPTAGAGADVIVDPATGKPIGSPQPQQRPLRGGVLDMAGSALGNVAGAIGLDELLPALGNAAQAVVPSDEEVKRQAMRRARYLDPSMQRTY